MHQLIEDFLDRATEGLRDDEELRRDARAELATHAEERLRELTGAGKPEDEAVAETLKALGEYLELAGELEAANRSRMNLRARVRLALRFALVPAAIAAALWASDWPSPLFALRAARAAGGGDWSSLLTLTGERSRSLSDRQRLVLYGDPNATNEVQRQKAIWEADPTNRVYFGNYFMTALSTAGDVTNLPPALLETARELDPDNAVYVYLEARTLLGEMKMAQAPGTGYAPGVPNGHAFGGSERPAAPPDGALLLTDAGQCGDDSAVPPPAYEVLDRERLDQAMASIEQALAMPEARRYQMDMLAERLELYGPPRRYRDFLSRAGLSASVLLPMARYQLELARATTAYGDLLLEEDEVGRAARFLDAWEPMAHQMLEQATTLIEVLIAAAIMQQGEVAAAVYREAGMEEVASRMQARAEAAQAPVRRWKSARTQGDEQIVEDLEEGGSLMARIMLPALGEEIAPSAFEPSRRLEFTVATEALVGVVTLLLFLVMTGCLGVALRWRFSRKGRVIPLLLMPGWRDWAAILGLGVLLPGALFLLVTRALPLSGHAYSVQAAPHKLIAEFGLLVMTLTTLPAWLTARFVRRRCRELDVPTDPRRPAFARWAILAGCVGMFIAWLFPAGGEPRAGFVLAGIGGVLAGLGCAAAAITSLVWGLESSRGLFMGTLHRSLIPALAATVVVLSLVSRPVLAGSEARYLEADTLFVTDKAGFTQVEIRVIEKLRGEMLSVLEALQATQQPGEGGRAAGAGRRSP